MISSEELTAKMEPFDSFWEGPHDIEKGYGSFYKFYKHNYLKHMPEDRNARILVISCGPGYFVNMLNREGYTNVLGIDSFQEKIEHATRHGLNCETARAFEFLQENGEAFDAIFCEQELNHLTKQEILDFLGLCWNSLRKGGRLVTHGLNGANPITGSEALAQNFDHYNTFTEYTFGQMLEYSNFQDIRVYPLSLYVFWTNPLNYALIAMSALYTLFFRVSFIMYGKTNKLFTKKIGAVCQKGRG
ncbi:methyltransferase family protein [Thiogranum longum]|uniref:Methyltransferase family protein n=1 Tax=Thiogranum longum TaxID=1537524 RepID=A0A4R1H8M5_9GAMM|nr:class I SAM-dependent methyltransferase [Thiogranum longum]TCK18187.1 methyltransferase family protein [Thiogranum longum]